MSKGTDMGGFMGTRGFVWDVEHYREGVLIDQFSQFNLIPKVGRDFLALAPFGGASAIPDFYVGLFDGNYLPAPEAVAADLPLVIGEFVGYSEAQRPSWDRDYDDGTHTNIASRAEFTATVSRTLYGLFMCSSAVKGSNNGILLSVMRFQNPRPVIAGDQLRASASIAYVPIGQV